MNGDDAVQEGGEQREVVEVIGSLEFPSGGRGREVIAAYGEERRREIENVTEIDGKKRYSLAFVEVDDG